MRWCRAVRQTGDLLEKGPEARRILLVNEEAQHVHEVLAGRLPKFPERRVEQITTVELGRLHRAEEQATPGSCRATLRIRGVKTKCIQGCEGLSEALLGRAHLHNRLQLLCGGLDTRLPGILGVLWQPRGAPSTYCGLEDLRVELLQRILRERAERVATRGCLVAAEHFPLASL